MMVVNGLKVIDVDHHDANMNSFGCRSLELSNGAFTNRPAIEEIREPVMHGEDFHLTPCRR